MKQSGDQWRANCPACRRGGDRALVVTKSKQAFYCFASGKGGDVIALVSHVMGFEAREAALTIAKFVGTVPVPPARNSTSAGTVQAPAPDPTRALAPLAYLQATHEAVQALGVSPETCQHFGAGYAPRGILRGRMAIPIHDRAGTLLAYCGRATKGESPTLTFPNGFEPDSVIFNAHRVVEGPLTLVRDPLHVLLAFESGIENVVAFLTDGITAAQLEQLASLVDEKKCEAVELF